MKVADSPNDNSSTPRNIMKRISSVGVTMAQISEQEELYDKTISYYEFNAGRKIKRKLDFNSPRTSEAAAQLGLTFKDCLTKY